MDENSQVESNVKQTGTSGASAVLHGGAERQNLRILNADTAPLTFSWYAIAPQARCTSHVHTGKAETWLIVQGHGEARVDGQSFRVGPGDALVTRPGQPHELTNLGEQPLIFVNMVTITGDEPVTTTELEA
jgi:mannose-6-phosphate isomerase-like protein (cupin superfamily)